ncbi:hypothetical protein BDQ12DRAFT_674297 [Crucibulum laeve]|uniref:F-box domain-containing protein n=1 Tax=Crucibulum laeve TaxID=68775 RepID=A0A5C3MDQ0_9AGAR|nr:hypothetical protein BDQ12DRAFT_674297 [Crucibulum laeve]
MSILPQEVLDVIIDQLSDDLQMLSDCSLVCRRWTSRSRYHLFYDIDLNNGPDILNFHKLIASSDSLSVFPKFLHMNVDVFIIESDFMAATMLAATITDILYLLPNLHSLSLEHEFQIDDERFLWTESTAIPFQHALTHALRLPTLTSLALLGWNITPLCLASILAHGQALQRLALERVYVMDAQDESPFCSPAPNTLLDIPVKPRIHNLTDLMFSMDLLDSNQKTFDRLLSSNFDFPLDKIRRLTLEGSRGFTPEASSFISRIGSSLEELVLSPCNLALNMSTLQVADATSLHTIHFEFRHCVFKHLRNPTAEGGVNIFEWMCDLLSTIRESNSLENLIIIPLYFRIGSRLDFSITDEEDAGWKALCTLLTTTKFMSLRHLDIKLDCGETAGKPYGNILNSIMRSLRSTTDIDVCISIKGNTLPDHNQRH